MLPAQPNQSLIDGLACLETLATQQEPMGSRELARRLRLDPTRVNRLLKTLAALGLAEQDERRKYRTGPGIHVLAATSLFGSGLIRRALGPLESLHRYGFIVALGVLWRDQTAYLYHAEPDAPGVAGLGRTALYPAASSGIGMALLAERSDSEIRELYSSAGTDPEVVMDGDNGLTSRLSTIRADGYAYVQTLIPDIYTLAVPVGKPAYAAIGFSGRFGPKQLPELVEALRATAETIS